MPRVQDEIGLRREALNLMEGRGAILETAREVSALLRDAGVFAAVIGGIAVVLHGHLRTTRDIDLLVGSPLEEVAAALEAGGFSHDPVSREFVREGIPIHLVSPEQAGTSLSDTVELEGIVTVTLPLLIEMKLRSGTANLLRAQDLADVIGLIRRHRLGGDFARHLEKSLRPPFRKLSRAVGKEG